jgi:peptide/nickel transport system ATP-binding protein
MSLSSRSQKPGVEFPGRRGTLRALDDISFSIAPGEILGVVGESGAGKSLTGAAIIGLLEPPGRVASGQILLEGQRIDNLPTSKCATSGAAASARSFRTR